MNAPYPWLVLAGIVVTLLFWARLARRDERLFFIYLTALGSAFLGAKVVYLLAEGWLYADSPERWTIWLTGKSILGALLGGYLGVEVAKKILGYRAPTGDFFAMLVPLGLLFGRCGCLLQGCCLGQVCATPHWWTLADRHGLPRWPAVPVEMGFNVAMLGVLALLRQRGAQRGQLFHIYLMAYGAFRFGHEYLRATPRLAHGLSGYQAAALAVGALGAWGYRRRAREHARGTGAL